MTIIAGATGSGKSAMALYSYVYKPLIEFTKKGTDINILYFSFEMSEVVILTRLLSMYLYEEYGVSLTYSDILSLQSPLSD